MGVRERLLEWFVAAMKHIIRQLAQALKNILGAIYFLWGLSTSVGNLIQAIDKKFNLIANYTNGIGDTFHN